MNSMYIIYTFTCMYVCMYVCMFEYVYETVCMYIFAWMHVCTNVCVYKNMCEKCMNEYICIVCMQVKNHLFEFFGTKTTSKHSFFRIHHFNIVLKLIDIRW